MPLVPSGGRLGVRRWPVVVVGALTVAGLLSIVVGVAVRLDSSPRQPDPTRLFRTPHVAPLPHRIGLQGWNSAAFVNDNLWTEGGRQFAVWVDEQGSPVVGRRQTLEGPWETSDLGRMVGNPLGSPTPPDHHRVYVVAVDAAGYVHVAGNMHSDPLRYVRSEKPFAIDSWVRAEMVGSEEESVTYPAFVRVPGGELLFFYRDGGAGHGDVVLNRLEAATGQWRRVGKLLDGRSSGESPYLQRIAVDRRRGVVHVVFLWRSGEDAGTNRDVSYLRSDDGGTTWRTSDGAPRALPVTHRTAEIVAPTTPRSPRLLNQGGLAVDPSGRPHAVFRVRGDDPAAALHVWQEGDRWRAEALSGVDRLAGRPALTGDGVGPLRLLWTERTGDEVDLRVAGLDGGRTTGAFSLGRLPVRQWEPTFDSAAADGELRMLLPLRAAHPSRQAAAAAVATWARPALR